MKEKLKRFIPRILIEMNRKMKIKRIRKQNLNKSTKKIFQDIYLKNTWGGKKGEFYSGPGSNENISRSSINMINNYINQIKKSRIKIIDLGCGDFRVGRYFISKNINYLGIDIVPELIQRNNDKFSKENIKFQCLDIVDEDLPEGDVCIIRQVLQHLSNTQIQKIIKKLSKYQYIFVIEHYPFDEKNCVPNKDKPCGQDIRLSSNSAVYLNKPPFNIKNIEEIFVTNISKEQGKIKTFIIKPIGETLS